jgi:hypothetical protein
MPGSTGSPLIANGTGAERVEQKHGLWESPAGHILVLVHAVADGANVLRKADIDARVCGLRQFAQRLVPMTTGPSRAIIESLWNSAS